jgi:hypothetical protein
MQRLPGECEMTAASLTTALGGRWNGRYGMARCPVHEDRTPSLKISDDPSKSDGVDLVCFAGCEWRDVKAALAPHLGGDRSGFRGCVPLHVPRVVDFDAKTRLALALRLWRQSVPLRGTLGERYLMEHRQLQIHDLVLAHALRWNERIDAIVALMTDPVSREPTGIHRTFVDPTGAKRDRRMLGRQGVIRLSPDDAVTSALGIAEGVEDALAVLLSGWSPVWVATNAGAIARLPVIPGIECMTVFADADEAGFDAANSCCARWRAAGRETCIVAPEAR